MRQDTTTAYGTITRSFHMIMAFLMIGLVAVGFSLGEKLVPADMRSSVIMLHKSTGIVVLLLVLLRILWRFQQQTPNLDHIPAWQRMAARMNINFLYLAMVAFPLSGIGMSLWSGRPISFYNLFTIPIIVEKNTDIAQILYNTHRTFGYLILISLALHILAALYHHFIIKDHVLRRMFSSLSL